MMRSRLLLLVLSTLGAVSGQNIAVVSQITKSDEASREEVWRAIAKDWDHILGETFVQLSLEETHTLRVEPTLEYIIKFVPTLEQSSVPLRVWLRSSATDAARPLLLTARQRTGAVSWQLPHAEGHVLVNEIERTLCPDDSGDDAPSDCVGDAPGPRGEFTLQVSSACAARVTLQLRVSPATNWRLRDALNVTAALGAPHVSHYRWSEGQARARLVVSSGDDVCATIAVQPYGCPILQTGTDIRQADTRMTVLRSGGYYISKDRYPLGFIVVTLVPELDSECRPEEQQDTPDWLWESVWGGAAPAAPPVGQELTRVKHLTLEIKSGLTRREYWVSASVTLSVFLLFYVLFGALVLAERWPAWYRLVAPRARLLPATEPAHAHAHTPDTDITEMDTADPVHRRRRGSTATFDSSDASDSDSADEETPGAVRGAPGDEETPGAVRGAPGDAGETPRVGEAATGGAQGSPATNGIGRVQADGGAPSEAVPTDGQRPFGLPARLHVAALARRRGRVLRARSQRYLHTLYTVAIFYALPVLQFVFAFQLMMNVGGSLDLCYYNWLCAHPLGIFSDFNHVLSNLGYLLLGALYMLQLRRRRMRRKRQPRDEEQYGIPPHYGLSASLGASLMVVGLLSASYHICPNRLNFQFDTAFMYVLTVLVMVKIYQSRHPDINARAHSTFAVLALIIALVVWGVLGGGPLFWSVFTVLHVFIFLLLSLRIYYVGQFRLEKASLAAAAASSLRGAAPLYTARLVALLLANAVNWAFAIYGLVAQPANIASHLLFVLLCNALLHMMFYLSMKLLHGERPRWYAWVYLGGAAAAWLPALYFFVSASSDWAASPAQSRLLNHECRLLRFYDSHDLWHALSSVALYLTLNALLTWDDGLAAVKRTDIAVF